MSFIPNVNKMKHNLGSTKGKGPVAPRAKAPMPSTSAKPKNAGPKNPAMSLMKGIEKNENISIRKIENGYITSSSTYSKKGGYKESQVFTAKHPVTGK